MRYVLLALVLVFSGIAGIWFRGADDHSVGLATVIVLSLLVLGADLLGPPKSRNGRIGSALLAGFLFAGGWYLGGKNLDAALDDCAGKAEQVRAALENHRETAGEYPASLTELQGFEIPGKRLLRGTVLKYSKTSDGYVLWYQDGPIHFAATQDHKMAVEQRYE